MTQKLIILPGDMHRSVSQIQHAHTKYIHFQSHNERAAACATHTLEIAYISRRLLFHPVRLTHNM